MTKTCHSRANLLNVILIFLLFTVFAHQVPAQNPYPQDKAPRRLKRVRANGVDLHYVEAGKGVPVILVHGGLDDYRMWEAQIEPFAVRYRVFAYSRRYNYPNQSPYLRPNHSAIIEAEDLAALIRKLKLGPVHVVGHSYGALTALWLAVKHPELVRTVVLAEPPVLRWVAEKPEGRILFNTFMDMWRRVGDALRRGKREEALRLTFNYFIGEGAFDQVPEAQRNYLMQNIREWQALSTSRDAFPILPRADVSKMKVPALMLSGGRTLEILKLVDAELAPLLANGERVVLPNATHDMWNEQPDDCRRAVLAFLDKH